MPNMFDYLKWRGDILFSQLPPNPADALIFSALSYIHFDGIVPETPQKSITLRKAAEILLAQPHTEEKAHVKQDIELLRAAAATERFGGERLTFYRSIFAAEKETQFAAVTFLLSDNTSIVSFRGTDKTLTGWKEDFNMSFCETVPAQREALRYLNELAADSSEPICIAGHSKGGNLAVYAAAKCDRSVQRRIREIFNHDGPGFTGSMMSDPGYLAVLPKIRTYIPQSSIVGMLLEHEEPYTVIRSSNIGFMQHDPYSWEIIGKDFIHMDEVTAGSRFIDHAIKNWLAGMTMEERSSFVDTLYELLTSGGANRTAELISPKNVRTYIRTLNEDESKRRIIAENLASLVQSMKNIERKI